ncbi:MFS transporter [Kitasatospora aureofaciens]|uniref:MFS transporter n=1 Tax=Kitasatospora aureofaciens TaxID=1894 RepID=UPI001C4820A2|nr:MFS transporter [Kitasatospora aureofaciens]MBV6698222.1 MFS transporter [Kitasatospora aureofaciens]
MTTSTPTPTETGATTETTAPAETPTTPNTPNTPTTPDYRLLLTATAVSRTGTAVGSLALPLAAVLALHSPAWQIGLLAALSTAAFLLLGLPAGAWVDRLPKRPVMITADLTRAALLATVPAAWALGHLTFPHLCAVALLTGTATVFSDIAAQSHLPALVGRDRLTSANAHLVTVDALAQTAGRSAAGFLVSLLTAPIAVLVDATSYLASACLLRRIHRPEPAPTAPPRKDGHRDGHRNTHRLASEIREGLRFVLGHPLLRPIALAGALTNLSVQICQTLLPVLFARTLHLPDAVTGLFFATGGVGVFTGSLLARPLARRVGAGRVLWMVGLGIAPLGVLVALVDRGPALWCAAGAWLLTTVKIGIDNVIKVSFRQHATPDHLLGRMNATMRVLLTGALTLGAALAGTLASLTSVRTALWVGAAGLMLVWIPVFRSPLRTARHLPGI